MRNKVNVDYNILKMVYNNVKVLSKSKRIYMCYANNYAKHLYIGTKRLYEGKSISAEVLYGKMMKVRLKRLNDLSERVDVLIDVKTGKEVYRSETTLTKCNINSGGRYLIFIERGKAGEKGKLLIFNANTCELLKKLDGDVTSLIEYILSLKSFKEELNKGRLDKKKQEENT